MIGDSLVFACTHACLITSVVSDSAILWTGNFQAPLSMGFSRQGYWSGLPFPRPGDLPHSGTEPESPAPPALQADSLPLNHWGGPYSSLLDIIPVRYREAQAKEPVAVVIRASQMVQVIKIEQNKTKKPASWKEMQDMRIRFLGWEDPLEKEMENHSSILAWRILWTEEPAGLQSMGSQRVRQYWVSEAERGRQKALLVLDSKLIICSNEGFILRVLLY